MLVYQYIGLPILYLGLDNYRAEYVTDQSIVVQVFIYTAITITLMILGFVVASQFFKALTGAPLVINVLISVPVN